MMEAILIVGVTLAPVLAMLIWLRRQTRRLHRMRTELAQDDEPSTEAIDHLMRGR